MQHGIIAHGKVVLARVTRPDVGISQVMVLREPFWSMTGLARQGPAAAGA
jgi:hypothetical protein